MKFGISTFVNDDCCPSLRMQTMPSGSLLMVQI
jgi:hypothetical protein